MVSGGCLVGVFLSFCVRFLLIPSSFSTDFEVHRNWKAITSSLPVEQWYKSDISEWTLDYPPLFALFEMVLSEFAFLFDEKMLLVTNLNYKSEKTILFLRLSVIFGDLILLVASYLVVNDFISSLPDFNNNTQKNKFYLKDISVCIVISNCTLIIVDNMHFQYNSVCFGLLFFSIFFLQKSQYVMSGVIYSILINFKHMFLCFAPIYFIYLFRVYCFGNNSNSFSIFNVLKNTLKLGLSVISVFILSFGPTIYYNQIPLVFSRLFPFGRGLCHAYWAPNFWAVYSGLDVIITFILRKLKIGDSLLINSSSTTRGLVGISSFSVLPNISPFLTSILVLITTLPILVFLWKYPYISNFPLSIGIAALNFFLFGWHIHEKHILMATIPLSIASLLNEDISEIFQLFHIVSAFSVFPLLESDKEWIPKILICFTNYLFCSIFLELFHSSKQKKLSKTKKLCFFSLGSVEIFRQFIHPRYTMTSFPFLGLLITSFVYGILNLILFLNLWKCVFSVMKIHAIEKKKK